MFHSSSRTRKSSIRNRIIATPHGKIRTPFFMPDATQGAVKLIESEKIKTIGVPAMVVNTLHLYLQPGLKIIQKAGGIHQFMNWQGPLLSDSGGYQVFSLIYKTKGRAGKVYEDKVVFRSPIDGSRHELTPEKSIQIQFALGTDMMVCLDDVRPNDTDRREAEASVERTIKWARRCKREFEKQVRSHKPKVKSYHPPLLFGVVQGGIFPDLRRECAKELVKIGFDGLGYGARPIDENGKFLEEVLTATTAAIPENYLRFALGVGTPEDVIRFARLGWDMFDCVIPTREGRHGRLYQSQKSKIPASPAGRKSQNFGKDFYRILNITNAKFAMDFSPINADSKLPELREHSKAYLHHLFKVSEPLGQRLASLNNLEFYNNLILKIGS
ncbi:hypothetical protein A3B87_00750 [Candidatus Kuenenbacteria bacterium RIFCSPHIGHO2_02_FULL_39_13]|uniref:tRNA-guanine(15) transglycosylase-like domain-containing protein n=1 Tax=Candidatus Kuenenbacteria bacterium RIFCSPHIGHO2_02_FULL_39_13 TaxID=1798561 RepID=A0A1F6FP51_9BACT|nr:MAG: hypothetical protein A3B87_00750 [Candidatus Kuenenbacteria bacterium RIFCSPHIGHO2_02_FULL_39_13]